jgi:hypothetical protein
MKRHDEPDIHIVALVDQALEPDVRYLAEISIPGLSDTRVPIAVCRRVGRTAARDHRRMTRSPAEDAHDPVTSLKPARTQKRPRQSSGILKRSGQVLAE